MDLEKNPVISYELSFSSMIGEVEQIYLKIDRVIKVKNDIIITESGDMIFIKQIKKNITTNELNPSYVKDYILKKVK